MKTILIGILLITFKGLLAQYDLRDYINLSYWFDNNEFPPVLVDKPIPVIDLKTPYYTDSSYTRKFAQGRFYISKEGIIDTVVCGYPYFKYTDFEQYCNSAVFNPGIWHNRFTRSFKEFYVVFLDFNPIKKIKLIYMDSVSVGFEDGSRIVPVFDQKDYDYAFGNATFSKEFRIASNNYIDYVEFNIVVDSILKINRLGKYNIPERKGYSVKIIGDFNSEYYILINLRRNYYKVLDNLLLNLEPEDEYLLICQKNEGVNSLFFSTRFMLNNNMVIKPEYHRYTYSELRQVISINLRE